jgi:hypothetical protein
MMKILIVYKIQISLLNQLNYLQNKILEVSQEIDY